MSAPRGWQRPTALIGAALLVSVLSWPVRFALPGTGIDASWHAALYMAAHRGLHFGAQLIFTYGPLGWMRDPALYYINLGTIAFVYQVLLHVLLAGTLLHALRRLLPLPASAALVFVVLAATSTRDVSLGLAAIWCLLMLQHRPPAAAAPVVLYGGSLLGALETLVELRAGVILLICAAALCGGERRRLRVPLFCALAVLELVVLWLLDGQNLTGLVDFLRNGAEVVSGYSEAMSLKPHSMLALVLSIVLGPGAVAAAAILAPGGRRRWASAAVVALSLFALYKEGAVRADGGHQDVFFATLPLILCALAAGRHRALRSALVLGSLLLAVLLPLGQGTRFAAWQNVRSAKDELRLLLEPGERNKQAFYFLIRMNQVYGLDPATLTAVRHHTVAVEPWEAGAAWAQNLSWQPLPVFQEYQAYTRRLDGLNAAALEGQRAPQRVLLENSPVVDPQYPLNSIDGRLPAWDPPGRAVAMLCNYAPQTVGPRWLVLAKGASRCGPARRLGELGLRSGEVGTLPAIPGAGLLVGRLHGAGLGLRERARAFLYKARDRSAVINGNRRYRLVPGTAGDGLLLQATPAADLPQPFSFSPQAHTLSITGVAGSMRLELFFVPAATAR